VVLDSFFFYLMGRSPFFSETSFLTVLLFTPTLNAFYNWLYFYIVILCFACISLLNKQSKGDVDEWISQFLTVFSFLHQRGDEAGSIISLDSYSMNNMHEIINWCFRCFKSDIPTIIKPKRRFKNENTNAFMIPTTLTF
jgi:hypothetical protein